MKKLYFSFKVILLSVMLVLVTCNLQAQLSAGNIAFTGFNADGSDDVSFVALVTINTGEVIIFEDNEWNGTTWNDANENAFIWTATSPVAAGTIVHLNTVSAATPTASTGTIAYGASGTYGSNRGLGNSDEVLYAYQGSRAAPVFITAVANGGFIAANGVLTGTGLTAGTNAVNLALLDDDLDIASYTGARNNQASFAAYMSIVNTPANWNFQDASGDQSADGTQPDVPFSSTPFTLAGLPSVTLSVSANAGTEAAQTSITVTATASSAVSGDQSVTVDVGGVDITPGDYTLTGTTITILNGQTSGSVTFQVVDDAVAESLETGILTISSPSGGIVLGSPVSQNIDITDNDVVIPSVTLSVSANAGTEAAMTSITATVTASSPVSGNQTVSIAVSGAGITTDDYLISGLTITILNGQTTGTATFTIRNDAEMEGNETATLTISSPSGGITLGSPVSQNITITDNTCQALIRKSTVGSANGAEISAFDPASSRVFTVAGPVMEYYSLSNAGILSGPTNMPFGFSAPGGTSVLPNSVTIRNGIAAVSYAVVDAVSLAQQPGIVAFYNAATATYIHHVTVGYLPDMIIYTPDGTKLMTANEGEPNSYGQGNSFDPEGSVSIIDISGGVLSATVQTVGFSSFNGQIAALRAAGVRIYGPGATVAQDLEPEYIAFSDDGTRAYVTLQENNAVAEVDIATATALQILPLGLKNHNLPGNGLDASDRDLAPGFSTGTINIQNWPVFGMYQPDAISGFTVGGNRYYITANEGDSRAWTGFSEEVRVGAGAYLLDPTVFPNAATLKLNQNLGRLQLTNATGDTNNDGDFDQIHALGARSFSIWSSTFSQIFDSGDQLEQISAAQNPLSFNSDGTPASYDSRSDNKGPEPEAVTTGTVNGVLYAFVGTERTGDIYVYDISNPATPVFKQYIDHPADQGVEGLIFIPASQSPTGKALVISTAEVSRTVTVYEFSLVAPALVTANTTITTTQDASTTYGDCAGLVLKMVQNGAVPVAGNVESRVWIDPSVMTFNSRPYLQRHYQITPAANPTTSTARITLYATQAEFDNFNAVSAIDIPTGPGDISGIGNLRVFKFSGSSSDGSGAPGTYTQPGLEIDPADSDIVWNAADNRWEISFDVVGFSGFIIVNADIAILPLTWLEVKGTLNAAKKAVISWKVSENGVNNYEVEKSIDGIHFSPAITESSRGDGVNNYQFTEATALNGTAWYRIRQNELSGRYGYSSVIKLGNQQKGLLTVYPNPVNDILTINAGTDMLNTQLQLTDMSGKVMQWLTITQSSFTLNITGYASGIYLLKADNGTVIKIIKQ